MVFYALLDNSLFYCEIAGGFIGRSICEGRVVEQPKVRVIFSKCDAISWRGSLVARGPGTFLSFLESTIPGTVWQTYVHVQINRRIARSRVSKWKRADCLSHLVFFFAQV